MYAARNENPEVTRVLLRHGARLNREIGSATTAFSEAWRRNENIEVVRILLDAGAAVELGPGLLVSAAVRGAKWLELLIEYGADPNLENDDGWTALMIAADRARYPHQIDPDVVALLLHHGADPTFTNNDGHTAVTIAELSGADPVITAALRRAYDEASESR